MSTVTNLVINISTFVAVSVEVVLVTLILFHDFVVRYVKSASVIFVTASYYIAPFLRQLSNILIGDLSKYIHNSLPSTNQKAGV